MFYRFESILAVAVIMLGLIFGAFFVIPPLTPSENILPENKAADDTDNSYFDDIKNISDAQMQSAIDSYIEDFDVKITPYSPSSIGERVQVSVTNISPNTYIWAILYIVFVDGNGNIIKTITGGAYSSIYPNDTKDTYISAVGLENALGFVYGVEAEQFIYDENLGLLSR
jgi:hypothetical protein